MHDKNFSSTNRHYRIIPKCTNKKNLLIYTQYLELDVYGTKLWHKLFKLPAKSRISFCICTSIIYTL